MLKYRTRRKCLYNHFIHDEYSKHFMENPNGNLHAYHAYRCNTWFMASHQFVMHFPYQWYNYLHSPRQCTFQSHCYHALHSTYHFYCYASWQSMLIMFVANATLDTNYLILLLVHWICSKAILIISFSQLVDINQAPGGTSGVNSRSPFIFDLYQW